MPKIAYVFECHCCREKETFETKEAAEKAGWIQISIDGMIDRHWLEYDLCKTCSTVIATAFSTRQSKYK